MLYIRRCLHRLKPGKEKRVEKRLEEMIILAQALFSILKVVFFKATPKKTRITSSFKVI